MKCGSFFKPHNWDSSYQRTISRTNGRIERVKPYWRKCARCGLVQIESYEVIRAPANGDDLIKWGPWKDVVPEGDST